MMKILGLKFKNINSLVGEWDIRFDRPPLSDTGLFAIVGPNGSGKSSILDAITLGLYGETARLKHPEPEITSWQADESYSEVTFGVGEEVYRSRWWFRKQDGTTTDPQMSLSGVNGTETLLEDRVIRVRSRIEELTGLDFKRFCRSVLLAQGEFSALLSALESERLEILEKIVGTEMAQEMEAAVHERAMIEKDRLTQLKETAAGYPVEDRGRLNELEQEIDRVQDELGGARRDLEELETLEDWLETVKRLEDTGENDREILTEAEGRYRQIQEEMRRLDQAHAARPFAERIAELDELAHRKDETRGRLEELEQEIPANEQRLRQMEERLEQNRVELEEARKQLEARADEFDEALRRDREIEAETQRFLDAVSRFEALERSRKEMLQRQEELTVRIAEGTKRSEQLSRALDQHATDAKLDNEIVEVERLATRLIETRRQQETCRSRIADATKLERLSQKALQRAQRSAQRVLSKTDRLAARAAALEQRLAGLLGDETPESLAQTIREHKKRITACRELLEIGHRFQELGLTLDVPGDLARAESRRNALEEAIGNERAVLDELREQIVWRDTFRRLSAERSGLRSGDPCPLCGSLHHPFVEESMPDLSELNRTVDEREKTIETLQRELDEVSERVAGLQARARTVETIQREWSSACERARVDWTITDVGLAEGEIRVLEGGIKHSRSLLRSARWKTWRLQWIESKLNRKKEKLNRKEQSRTDAQRHHDSEVAILADLQTEMKGFGEEEQLIRLDLAGRIRAYGEPLPEAGAEAGVLERLRTRRDDFNRQSGERDRLTAELQTLEAQREALSVEMARAHEESNALAAETEAIQSALAPLKAERDSLYGAASPREEHDALESVVDNLRTEQVELAQSIDALFQTLESQRRALPQQATDAQEAAATFETAERELVDQISTAGLASLDAARDSLSALEEEEMLLQKAALAEQALGDARSHAAAADQALETARSEQRTDLPLGEVRNRISDAIKVRDALQERADDLERTLSERRRAAEEYESILRDIAEQEKTSEEAAAEEAALCKEDGLELRKRLQRLMLDRLAEQANQHLARLSDRYLLQTGTGDGLGLCLEDSILRKTHRSVDTLSGGESFLVSLCLALGLAEMAARHRKIESLFLDEGFGTLDEETLYKVIAALKGLRSNGKVVGVISHVKRLADEIPTQIRVEKEPGGTCRLTVVA